MNMENISSVFAGTKPPPPTPFEESVWVLPEADEDYPLQLSSTGITRQDRNYRIVSEGRTYYVLEYIIRGRGHLFIDNRHFKPSAGDFYLLPPNMPHEYYTLPGDPWEKIWFNVSGTLIDSLLAAYRLSGAIYLQDVPLENLFRKGMDSVRFYKNTSYTVLAGVLTEIISTVRQLHGEAGRKLSDDGRRMKNYIDQHWQRPFVLEDLCRISGKSAAQTLRIFKRDWSITPGAYHHQRRFAMAASYLTNTGNTVRDIALLLGFANEFHFSQWFKKQSGISPKFYRQQHGQTAN
ncbi:MAG: AraC family transcriptional regulator [Lentisphaerae bacterium]|nr:AraC family transcriptional regulator [Lentisphaerota bacterium]